MTAISLKVSKALVSLRSLSANDQRDLGSLALAILVLALYFPVFAYPFIGYDDFSYVVHNPHVTVGLNSESIRWAFTSLHGNTSYWHPLTWLSHQLDFHFFQFNAGAHHLTSVVLHAANSILVFLLVKRFVHRLAIAFVLTALFALHPLRVESVAWVAERKDVLCAFFYFATILLYFHYAGRPTFIRYIAVALACLFSLMSKPMAVTLPCVLLMLDVWPLRRYRRAQGSETAAIPYEESSVAVEQSDQAEHGRFCLPDRWAWTG